MKKLLKFGITIAVAAMMVVVGIFAAINATFSVTSKVSFTASNNVRVDIDAFVAVGKVTNLSDLDTLDGGEKLHEHSTETYTAGAAKTPAAWEIDDVIQFDGTKTIYYVIDFENVSVTNATYITVTLNYETGARITATKYFAGSEENGTYILAEKPTGSTSAVRFVCVLELDRSTPASVDPLTDFSFGMTIVLSDEAPTA